MLVFYLLLLIFGLVLGSFLSMLSYRLPRGISILGRSFCDACKRSFPWYQNIPVFYYLASGGKCGVCGKKISLRYPLIETFTGITFVGSGILWNTANSGFVEVLKTSLESAAFPILLLLVACFLSLIITDLEHTILPDSILALMGIVTLIFLLTLPSPALFVNLFWGFLVFSFFLFLHLATQGRGMGFGDVKMSFILGSFFGFPYFLVWLFLAFLSGAVAGVGLLVVRRAKIGQPIPFGPFLILAAWVTIFWGDKIISWYWGMM